MAAGVRDLAANIALRDQLWRDLVPFDRPPAAARPELADVDPAEAAARLQRARLIDNALAEAIATGDRGAIGAIEQRPRRGGPRGTGRLATLVGDFDAVTGTSDLSFGPIGYPYIIRDIQIAAHNFGVAGSNGEVQLRLFVTGADLTGDTVTPSEPLIFPDFRGGTSTPTMVKVTGTATAVNAIRAAIPVLDTGRFLTAQAVMTPAADVRAALQIVIEEMDPGLGLAAGEPLELADLGRRYVGGSRPPSPRQPGRRLPVGFTFNVQQGGKILFSRTVPYSSSTAREAGYNPVTGGAGPNVIVHQTEQSWSNAFELERQRRG